MKRFLVFLIGIFISFNINISFAAIYSINNLESYQNLQKYYSKSVINTIIVKITRILYNLQEKWILETKTKKIHEKIQKIKPKFKKNDKILTFLNFLDDIIYKYNYLLISNKNNIKNKKIKIKLTDDMIKYLKYNDFWISLYDPFDWDIADETIRYKFAWTIEKERLSRLLTTEEMLQWKRYPNLENKIMKETIDIYFIKDFKLKKMNLYSLIYENIFAFYVPIADSLSMSQLTKFLKQVTNYTAYLFKIYPNDKKNLYDLFLNFK